MLLVNYTSMKKARKVIKKEIVVRHCKECVHAVPITRFHTLTVDGKRPTLAECPFWTLSKCVLLSQKSCEHFTEKQ